MLKVCYGEGISTTAAECTGTASCRHSRKIFQKIDKATSTASFLRLKSRERNGHVDPYLNSASSYSCLTTSAFTGETLCHITATRTVTVAVTASPFQNFLARTYSSQAKETTTKHIGEKVIVEDGCLISKEGEHITITNLGDLVTLVDHLSDPLIWDEVATDDSHIIRHFNFPFGLWFRGESERFDIPMLPSLFRPKFFYDEPSMFNEFVMENSSKYGNLCSSTFEWLTLMQHYNMPTRLLDWTENLLVATYFATNPSTKDTKDEFVNLYILNALRLNALSNFQGILTPNQLGHHLFLKSVIEDKTESALKTPEPSLIPISVLAKRLSPRVHAQLGIFTLHGGKRVWKVNKPLPGVINATRL